MRAITLVYCMLLAATIFMVKTAMSQKTEPRRDDTYPSPDILKKKLQLIHDTCISITGITEEAIKKFSGEEIHEDDLLKCYMYCIFDEMDVLHDNGEVHLEKVLDILPEAPMHDMAINMDKKYLCLKGATNCERAFWSHSCWKKIDPDISSIQENYIKRK